MELLLQKELDLGRVVMNGPPASGIICEGQRFDTDNGKIFIKINGKPIAQRMFQCEAAGLTAISKTDTVRVPRPLKVLDNPTGGALLVMDFLEMSSLDTFRTELGAQMARLHLYNPQRAKMAANDPGSAHKHEQYVAHFGFHVHGCHGNIPVDNSWHEDWVTFFIRSRLQPQFTLIEQDFQDREVASAWNQLLPNLSRLFTDIKVTPSLLHGDFWYGNTGETSDGPVVFDPAPFYGHHEFDVCMASVVGQFGDEFFDEYYRLIPRAPGFDGRSELYRLYNMVNHWNHFGEKYRSGTLSSMDKLNGLLNSK